MAKTTSTAAPEPQIKAAKLRTFHQRLHAWYETHGRHDLPWRNTSDPYHVWLSEVMLQQTKVATVLARFYKPFLTTFPTAQHLAAAPRDAVMKAWEGLGYYRRAGFLHEAAKKSIEGDLSPLRASALTPAASGSRNYGATQIINELREYPGIGRNTAHAIAAFAYKQPVAILEANVKRIVARIFAWEKPSEDDLWAGADALLNKAEPFHYNQAMMDLGSLVCTPRAPDCPACPANSMCQGKHAPELYPTPKAKKKTPTHERYILVLEDAAGRLHLEVRSDALLGGLYGFPQVPTTTDLRHPGREMNIAVWENVGDVVQVYSHFRLQGAVKLGKLPRRMSGKGWYLPNEISVLPLSGVDHKVLALVTQRNSAAKPVPKAARKRLAR